MNQKEINMKSESAMQIKVEMYERMKKGERMNSENFLYGSWRTIFECSVEFENKVMDEFESHDAKNVDDAKQTFLNESTQPKEFFWEKEKQRWEGENTSSHASFSLGSSEV